MFNRKTSPMKPINFLQNISPIVSKSIDRILSTLLDAKKEDFEYRDNVDKDGESSCSHYGLAAEVIYLQKPAIEKGYLEVLCSLCFHYDQYAESHEDDEPTFHQSPVFDLVLQPFLTMFVHVLKIKLHLLFLVMNKHFFFSDFTIQLLYAFFLI
jgi:hypothetical protein